MSHAVTRHDGQQLRESAEAAKEAVATGHGRALTLQQSGAKLAAMADGYDASPGRDAADAPATGWNRMASKPWESGSVVPLTEVERCAESQPFRGVEEERGRPATQFFRMAEGLLLFPGNTGSVGSLSIVREGRGEGPPAQRARRIPVRQADNRPVLKHGPRSSTCMRA